MIIDCISDLHGHYPKLDGGDLLIVAGDLTARDTYEEYCKFYDWLDHQNYKKKLFICGNHDNYIQKEDNEYLLDLMKSGYERFVYLCDSGTEFEGLKIWGSPWTKTFPGMNPKCKAFTVDTEEELKEKFELIPDDIDILITHSPPFGVLDSNINAKYCGSTYLFGALKYKFRPKLHVFGHIHECYGQKEYFTGCISVNASYVNEQYQPVNKPVRVIL